MTTNNLNKLAIEHLELKRTIDALKKDLERIDADIKAGLAELNLNMINLTDAVITLSEISSTRIDTKKLKADFPEIYDVYGVTTVSQRLNVK